MTQLKMKEDDFWKVSPRKFFALVIAFNEMNEPEKEQKKSSNVIYADDLLDMFK